jgi:D-sedoheptulose 7-phosphate isomerase
VTRVDSVFAESADAAEFARGYLRYLAEILEQLDADAIADFIAELLDARERGARIFFIGNGGSAATASHFANDIAIGSQTWEKPFRAVSLTENTAIVTAIANDHGYGEIFTQQLRAQMSPGDLVVAISVSGNSPNVVDAVEFAKTRGARTTGLTGFTGGRLAGLVDVHLHVPTEQGEYGPAEDVHMIFDHLVGAYLVLRCRELQR